MAAAAAACKASGVEPNSCSLGCGEGAGMFLEAGWLGMVLGLVFRGGKVGNGFRVNV